MDSNVGLSQTFEAIKEDTNTGNEETELNKSGISSHQVNVRLSFKEERKSEFFEIEVPPPAEIVVVEMSHDSNISLGSPLDPRETKDKN